MSFQYKPNNDPTADLHCGGNTLSDGGLVTLVGVPKSEPGLVAAGCDLAWGGTTGPSSR
ncbi:hypothetical protein [Nisaea sp.]|uniref:hypothetical protein n=1 Tax=Nisaea sp. TaxID=2024842 RepID=UPI003B52B84E